MLDLFHKLTLQGKLTLYDFYLLVLHISDNLQLEKTIVSMISYSVFFELNQCISVPISRIPSYLSNLA